MNKRIEDKIIEIETFLEELLSVLPKDFENYKEDWKIRDICERHFEKIIEASVDLSFMIIKNKGLITPKDDKNSFDILNQENIISDELAEKLKEAKGMRNIIAHEYGKIEDEIVFESVTEHLEKDIKEFISIIKGVKDENKKGI